MNEAIWPRVYPREIFVGGVLFIIHFVNFTRGSDPWDSPWCRPVIVDQVTPYPEGHTRSAYVIEQKHMNRLRVAKCKDRRLPHHGKLVVPSWPGWVLWGGPQLESKS